MTISKERNRDWAIQECRRNLALLAKQQGIVIRLRHMLQSRKEQLGGKYLELNRWESNYDSYVAMIDSAHSTAGGILEQVQTISESSFAMHLAVFVEMEKKMVSVIEIIHAYVNLGMEILEFKPES